MRQCHSDKVIKFHGSGLKNDGVLVSYVKVWVIFHPGSTAKVKQDQMLIRLTFNCIARIYFSANLVTFSKGQRSPK